MQLIFNRSTVTKPVGTRGDPHTGLIHLESALACKYVAAEALRSLNKIFAVMLSASPRDPNPVMVEVVSSVIDRRWGLLLLRPEVNQLGHGCDTLEQAALMAAQLGDRQPMSLLALLRLAGVAIRCGSEGAVRLCVEALRRRLPEGGTPIDPMEPSQQLRCVEARVAVYREIAAAAGAPSGRDPTRRVAAAVYDYIRQLDAAPYCRMQLSASAEQGSAATPPHMHLVHMIQSADPEDPWLQAEWGRTLTAVGRTQEAVLHLSVAAMLLQSHISKLQSGRQVVPPPSSQAPPAPPTSRQARRILVAMTVAPGEGGGPAAAAAEVARQKAAERVIVAEMRRRGCGGGGEGGGGGDDSGHRARRSMAKK
ncbi:hypothetical protein VOLCADRAFT_106786 [Volvox carteri f. nagariensis]|uniref:Uncharacterized protein n=1 Tax=Volvox carteri f. nagariensis TaxID=3068 RepID=D8U9R2_VOLCA|nr:uncharacterized protein VOLCADRAFT_106786 [Volvox carteri f. nagariensis]EFJ43454.1 hypothetical protein VOLCADRAFT_106786 [Volvox carteri f. nagariensis]|eukprot:XP_002955383.1 hypothetical protein VOLCADRAFT_106786 [Volvox carteri f. nagariensis]